MLKFIGKSLLLAGILLVLTAAFFVISTKEPYREQIAFWTVSSEYPAGKGEAETYIERVKEVNSYTKLILGDSVCNQMFNDLQEYNDEYCIVGNNRGLTMAGQYLLLNEFLESHQKITDVYVIVGLDALESEIDTTYGYQYVVVPFSRADALGNLEEETLEQMSDMFGAWALRPAIAEIIGDSNPARKLYLNYLKEKYADEKPKISAEFGKLSNTTVLYLKKMYERCKMEQIRLHLLPDPLLDDEFRREKAQLLEEEFKRTGLNDCFPDYFSMLHYYSEEEFIDGVHFGEGFDTQEVFNQKIQEIYLRAGYLDGLKLQE